MNKHIFEIRKRRNPYVFLDKGFLSNPQLTMQAKGLLAYLLSLPDDWKIYRNDLVRRFANGEKALRSAIKELLKNGYMVRKQDKDEKSRFGRMTYLVFEAPEAKDESASLFPPSGKPCGGNRQLPINNEINKEEPINQSAILAKLKGELESFGWVGDMDSLTAKAGGIEAALYFWERLKPLLAHVSPECRGGFISKRFSAEAKLVYSEYLRQEETKAQARLEEARSLARSSDEEAAREEKKKNLLMKSNALWNSWSIEERNEFVEKYLVENDCAENILSRGFNPKTGELTDSFAQNLIFNELAEED